MIELNSLNAASVEPSVGDVLVIQAKKSGSKKIMCQVKDVVKSGKCVEVILQKSTNSFFNWDMYICGESWVCRVWNLGGINLSTSSNSMKNLSSF